MQNKVVKDTKLTIKTHKSWETDKQAPATQDCIIRTSQNLEAMSGALEG